MKLKELGIIITGNTPRKNNKKFYNSDDICFFKPSDLDENIINDLYYSEEYISENARNCARILPENTLLMTCIGTIGKVGILKKEATCNQQINAIIPNNLVLPEYLGYLLLSKKDYLKKKANAPVVPIINKTDFSNINVNICDIDEQRIIVNKLNKVNGLINFRKKAINRCDSLIKSQFVEMFENKKYPKLSGKELFTFSSGKFLEEDKRKKYGIPVYGGNGIIWYTDQPLIDYNTIIFGRVGAYCGNVKKVNEPVWITDNAIYIKTFKKEVYNLNFLFYMLEYIDFSRFAQHSGQPKITQKPLEEYNYVVPPIELQNDFAQIVEQIDKQKFINKNLFRLLGKILKKCYNSIIDFR